ncbi:MAG: hypothetical protein KJP08_02370 [Gammaproteobacteria bacterium]|nr:hypothetical protein [Gammaproteobacteria bacterium]NNF48516.1 hypothetical protein [Woeseiaceae bacterium]MBT8093630.1 hypothetical protein [Gammaproteobacteria bacterium]MBT8106308.1 hypothetical protein [Gammaproteobacteria bacterium]NNK26322.1 hypothetical protein [Woeseiaceae bacterium]
MRIVFYPGAILALTLITPAASFAQDTHIEAVRAELAALRSEYDARIAELERRLAVAEQNAAQATAAARPAPSAPSYMTGDPTFNPAIGVVFQGFLNANEGEPGEEEGFAVGETELIMNANVDDKFAAYLTAALAFEDGESAIEIEEAWVETTALPAGLSARFGRMFSGFGYENARHMHTLDFTDRALPYQAFFDEGRYADNGVQVRWLAPTDLFLELGGELMQGEGDPSGVGAHTLFANVGGDVGTGHSWLAGLSRLEQDSGQEVTGAHLVWKWAPHGNWKQRNFIFQAEYLENRIFGTDEGWYAQAVYQPIPRWRVGARLDGLRLVDEDPKRQTVMVDWSNSEFSRLRLQFTNNQTGPADVAEWSLQYIHSIGAHGAHTF